MKHARTIDVEGLGEVTVKGLPAEELSRRYPELPGEMPIEKLFAAADSDGMVPAEFLEHPKFTREILGQVIAPELTAAQVVALSGEARRQILDAIAEAHPETRRIHRAMGGMTQ